MRKLNSFATAIVIGNALSLAALLPQPAAAVTGDELTAIVNKAKVIKYQVLVRLTDATTAQVSLYRVPSSQAKDCKIDAVLLAKTIMAADPKILVADVIYLADQKRDRAYRGTVEVRSSDVKLFAQGEETAASLLATLRFKENKPFNQITSDYESINQYTVRDGIFRPERVNFYSAILNLAPHYAIAELWKKFRAIEDNLTSMRETQLASQMSELRDQINSAQQQVTTQMQQTQGRKNNLAAQPGYAIHRRQRIVQAINNLASNGQNVYSLQAKYANVEQYARLGDKVHADVAMDNLEIELNLTSYKGD